MFVCSVNALIRYILLRTASCNTAIVCVDCSEWHLVVISTYVVCFTQRATVIPSVVCVKTAIKTLVDACVARELLDRSAIYVQTANTFHTLVVQVSCIQLNDRSDTGK